MKDISSKLYSFGQGVGGQGEGDGEDEVLGGAEQSGGAVLRLRLTCKAHIFLWLMNPFQNSGVGPQITLELDLLDQPRGA